MNRALFAAGAGNARPHTVTTKLGAGTIFCPEYGFERLGATSLRYEKSDA